MKKKHEVITKIDIITGKLSESQQDLLDDFIDKWIESGVDFHCMYVRTKKSKKSKKSKNGAS